MLCIHMMTSAEDCHNSSATLIKSSIHLHWHPQYLIWYLILK